jgi:phage terminase small subunit
MVRAEKKPLLTAKQQQFVREFLIDLNASDAARRAGYSLRTAEQQGYQLLRKPAVAAAIAEAQAERAQRTEVTADQVLAELARIGFANMLDFVKIGASGHPVPDFSSLDRDKAAALIEVTLDRYVDSQREAGGEVRRVKFKLADKRAALVDLGKHLGLFKDRLEISTPQDEAELAAAARDKIAAAIDRLATAVGTEQGNKN